jgi:hypothetical protein
MIKRSENPIVANFVLPDLIPLSAHARRDGRDLEADVGFDDIWHCLSDHVAVITLEAQAHRFQNDPFLAHA